MENERKIYELIGDGISVQNPENPTARIHSAEDLCATEDQNINLAYVRCFEYDRFGLRSSFLLFYFYVYNAVENKYEYVVRDRQAEILNQGSLEWNHGVYLIKWKQVDTKNGYDIIEVYDYCPIKLGDTFLGKENGNVATDTGEDLIQRLNDEIGRRITMEARSLPHNYIISGPPGSGKSHWVKDFTKRIAPNGCEERITFSDTTRYEDLFGNYGPCPKDESEMNSDESKIKYDFLPGPFCNALINAYIHPEENSVLIIEELNRGDAYNIFGDITLIVDRDDEGNSRYPVSVGNAAADWMTRQLASIERENLSEDSLRCLALLEQKKIMLPRNFFLLCTMNSADSGVNYIDFSFKRPFQQIVIDADGCVYGARAMVENSVVFGENEKEALLEADPRYYRYSYEGVLNVEDKRRLVRRINERIKEKSNYYDGLLISESYFRDDVSLVEFVIICLGHLCNTVFRNDGQGLSQVANYKTVMEALRQFRIEVGSEVEEKSYTDFFTESE